MKYKCISADSHLEIRPDRYAKRVPEKFRDRAPKVITLEDGTLAVLQEGQPLERLISNISCGVPYEEHRPFDPLPGNLYESSPGTGSPEQRLREQDKDGVDAEVLFPGNVGPGFWRTRVDKTEVNAMGSGLSVLASLALWAILFSFGAASAWGQADEKAKLIEGAKKEGKLVWYTSTNITESKPLLDDFEKQYPFVKGEIFRASGEKTLNRIVTEARAGRSDFDLVTISEVDALIEAKMLAPYRPPEAKSYIPEFKDPNGYWTAVYINYATIGYNPKMVSEKEAPKQWEDLLDPKWKGKISIDQEQYPWYGTLHKSWGRERAQKYMRALAKQGIQWRKGHTLIAQLMAAGEFPLSIIYAHRIEEMKQKGAPVEWVNTVNPIVVTVNAAGISTKPQHPNTAKLFYDYLLSRPAQQRLRTLRRIPARPDIEPFSPRMEQSKLKLQVEPSQTGPQFNQTIKEFREIFGL